MRQEINIRFASVFAMLVVIALVSVGVASAGIRITSPSTTQLYHVGDTVPIEFTSDLPDGYEYVAYVNGVCTDTWVVDRPGVYAIQIKATFQECWDCFDYDVMRSYFATV